MAANIHAERSFGSFPVIVIEAPTWFTLLLNVLCLLVDAVTSVVRWRVCGSGAGAGRGARGADLSSDDTGQASRPALHCFLWRPGLSRAPPAPSYQQALQNRQAVLRLGNTAWGPHTSIAWGWRLNKRPNGTNGLIGPLGGPRYGPWNRFTASTRDVGRPVSDEERNGKTDDGRKTKGGLSNQSILKRSTHRALHWSAGGGGPGVRGNEGGLGQAGREAGSGQDAEIPRAIRRIGGSVTAGCCESGFSR